MKLQGTRWSAVILLALFCAPAASQDAPTPNDQAADKQFQSLADRYWKILQARPRRDTAFDLWYRHYLDAGKLEELVQTVQQNAQSKSQDANAQLLLGIVLERRGQDEEALAAYASAEKLAPKNYYPPLVRGVLLVRRQQLDEAAESLAKASSLNPPRTDMPDIYKRLGRVRLQQGKTKEALEAFSQLAEKFPNDRQVLEELAQLLTEEGQQDEAIRRWEQLVELAKDDLHQQLQAQLEIAQLKIAQGKRKEGIVLLEQALERAKPESWLERDIRRRLEQAFLQSQDSIGLAAWCEERLKRKPQDLGTLLQLARALEDSGKRDEALTRYQEAVRLAPSRRDLREALINALVSTSRHAEAIQECEALAEKHPQDADVLRRLGQLHLAAADRAGRLDAERRVVEIWKKIAAIRPSDAALALQTAEACRQALTPGQLKPGKEQAADPSPLAITAEAYYREAVKRAPTEPQYHEYLGEFLNACGRRPEAIEAWSKIGEVPAPSAESYHRLAEVLASFDCLPEAIRASQQSLEHKPHDFLARDFHVGLLIKHKQHEPALAELAHLDRLAADDVAREKSLRRRVEVYAAAERTDREIQELQKVVREGKAQVRDHWLLGMLLANRWRYAEAARSFQAGQDLAGDHLPLAQAYAEALKLAGNIEGASEQYQRLAKIDPRYRFTYYQEIIQLQLQRGRTQQAQETADLLVRLSPSNVDAYRIRAAVAFRSGNAAEGLRNLRQAVKISPRDTEIRTQLARALAERGQASESLEHYWRSFELSDGLSGKLSLVAAIVDVARKAAKTDEVIEQLRRLRLRQDEPKTLTLCLVEAHLRLKRNDDAKRELLTLLEARGDDVDVLRQLAQVSERMRSWDAAIGYQERVVALDPSRPQLEALAGYFSAKSDYTAAARIWERMLLDATDDTAAASVVDRQLQEGRIREALALAELRLARTPESWPLLLRAGSACLALQKSEDARLFFEKLLSLPDEPEPVRLTVTSPPVAVAPAIVVQQTLSIPGGGIHVVTGASGSRYTVTTAGNYQVTVPAPAFGMGFPEAQDLLSARSAYSRVSLLQNYSTRTATSTSVRTQVVNGVTVRTPLQTSTRPNFPLPQVQNLEQAKVEATVVLYTLAARRSELSQWFASHLQTAGEDVRQLRRAAIASTAMGTIVEDLSSPLLTRLETARPDDPLPHLIRLSPSVSRTIPTAGGTPESAHVQNLKRSFDWLCDRRPEARGDLVFYYLSRLIALRDTATTAAVVDQELATATRFVDLGLMASLVLRSGDETMLRSMLKRGSQFKVNRDAAAAEMPYMKLLLDHALANPRLSTPEDSQNVLAIAERYLTLPAPTPPPLPVYSPFLTSGQAPSTAVAPTVGSSMPVARPTFPQTGMPMLPGAPVQPSMPVVPGMPARGAPSAAPGTSANTQILQAQLAQQAEQQALLKELSSLDRSLSLLRARTGVDPSTSSQMQALVQRRQAILNALRTRGYAQQMFPAPNAWLDVDRLNLLQGLQLWLKQSGRQGLLDERLAQRAAEAEGADQKTFRLAGIYAKWWADEKSEATKRLEQWSDAQPEEKLLRLTLAQAHFTNEDPRQSLAALEQIEAPEAELRAAIDHLRSEIRRRWSDFAVLRDLTGHTHVVRAVAFSPDGKQLVSGSYDRSVRIWNARTGRMERLLPGHKDMILAVAWSGTGEFLASAGYDGVRLWSATSGTSVDAFADGPPVRALAFSPDGKLLASAGDDKVVRLWNVLLGSELATLSGHEGPVLGLAFSPDGKLLASASRDHTIRLWDVATRRSIETLRGHSAAVTSVAFSPDGARLASGGEDKHVMLWPLAGGKVGPATLQQHTDAVQAVAFSGDGQTLASAGADKCIKLWRLNSRETIPASLIGHTHTISSLAFAPANPILAKEVLASSGFDEHIKLWSVSPETTGK